MKAVILTKSAMKAHGVSGVCTTAYDLDNNRLVRFVSNREGAPIPFPYHKAYDCLDMVTVEVLEECPHSPQAENLLVNIYSFESLGKYAPGIKDIYERISCLHHDDPSFMKNKSFKLDDVSEFEHSIEIKKVSGLFIWKDKTKTLAGFDNYPKFYHVTDARYNLDKNPEAETKIGDAYIVVSIPYENYYDENKQAYIGFYKFVAAIYPIL